MNSQVICECPICFDVIGDTNNITTECGHKFHASCLMTNVSCNGFSCPCCRSVMATIDSDTESDSDSESEADTDSDTDSYSTESTNDNSYEYEFNRNNDYVLRGLRFFTNQIENLENNQQDESDEENEVQISRLPSVSFIGNKILESGITLHDLIGAMVSIHIDYQIDSAMFERYSPIWRNLNNIITTEVSKNHTDTIEPTGLVADTEPTGLVADTEPIQVSVQFNQYNIQSKKQIKYFTTIDQIRQDLLNYPIH